MPATWRWCAPTSPRFPVVLASATPSIETEVNARRGRYRRLQLPERFGGQHMPGVEAIDLTREGPPRGRFVAPRLAEAVQDRVGARRAGAAVPQPPRLRAAHAVPRLRLSLRLPELRCVAGRSPLQAPARVPPLRLRDAAPRRMPEMPGDRRVRRLRPRRRAARGGGGDAVSGSAHHGALERPDRDRGAHARGVRGDREGPCRHRHRHPAGREGAPFSEAQPGRHRRCRSRARQRRSARGRAHLPAAAPGRSAARAAQPATASSICRPTSPIIR